MNNIIDNMYNKVIEIDKILNNLDELKQNKTFIIVELNNLYNFLQEIDKKLKQKESIYKLYNNDFYFNNFYSFLRKIQKTLEHKKNITDIEIINISNNIVNLTKNLINEIIKIKYS